MASEVITLDSDDEDASASTSAMPAMPAMGFNPANYTDLLTPMTARASPSLPANARGRGRGRGGPSARGNATKRPGPMPPFAVFAQDERPKLLQRQPNLSFVDCNRLLGELWHELPEVKKKLYRIKAKKIQDSRLQAWCQVQQAQRGGLARTASSNGPELRSQSIAPRQSRTHGFAVFVSEKKAEYAGSDQSPRDMTKVMAQAWRKLSKLVRRDYDKRAAQINAMADVNYIEQLKRLNRLRHPGQTEPVAPAPLKIASITSMSPKPLSPAPANPALKLPSSISISRVEPEVTVVAESSPSMKSLEQLRANHQLSVTKGTRSSTTPKLPLLQRAPELSIRGGRPLARGAKFVQNRRPVPPVLPSASPIYPVPGRLPSASRGAPGGLKRPMRGSLQAPPAKQFRKGFYPHQASPTEFGLPINNRNLSAHDTLCRLCGVFLSRAELVFTLSDKPVMLKMIEDCLGLTIIPDQDRAVKLPNVVCNKCCSSICAFNKFKVSIVQGLAKLNRLVEIRKSRQSHHQQQKQSQSIEQPNHSEESILPDLNTDDLEASSSSSKLSSLINVKDEPLDREEHETVDQRCKRSPKEESVKLGNGVIKSETNENKEEEKEHGYGYEKSAENEQASTNGTDPLNFFQIGEAHSIDQFDNTDDESNGVSSNFALRDHSESMNMMSEEDSQHALVSQNNEENQGEHRSKGSESQEDEDEFDGGEKTYSDHPDNGQENEEDNGGENGDEEADPQEHYETDPHNIQDEFGQDNGNGKEFLTNDEEDQDYQDDQEELETGDEKCLDGQSSQNEDADPLDRAEGSEKNGSEFKNPLEPKARAISQDTDDHSTADESQDEDNSGSSTESQSEDTSSGSDHSGNIRASTDGSTTTLDDDHEPTKDIEAEGIAQGQNPVEEPITNQSLGVDEVMEPVVGENAVGAQTNPECLNELEGKLRSLSPEDQLATAINSIQSEEFSCKPRPIERNSTDSLNLREELPPDELPPPCQESESAVEAILT
ncbi:uncharacterized protein LOC131888390 [Tigriopus californicus]|uniref:uncharacterized protein LOC131888390 n=1 Tax=Tigriopus californicus TaxID=6832 RepID=UPI0027DA5708|nr:uncharacterized protein LOC131888390 [Tigriopus californicus]